MKMWKHVARVWGEHFMRHGSVTHASRECHACVAGEHFGRHWSKTTHFKLNPCKKLLNSRFEQQIREKICNLWFLLQHLDFEYLGIWPFTEIMPLECHTTHLFSLAKTTTNPTKSMPRLAMVWKAPLSQSESLEELLELLLEEPDDSSFPLGP